MRNLKAKFLSELASRARSKAKPRTRLAVGLVLAVLAPGCLHHHHPRSSIPRPGHSAGGGARASVPPAIVQGEEGFATWYGHPYHGRRASSGEVYNMYDLTAAHRTLPFGTPVRVHDLDNGRDVEVRINDRGPFVDGRVIDLSYAAARALQMVGPGMARVRLEILGLPAPGVSGAEQGVYAVQVGAFQERANAERLEQRIAAQFGPVAIQSFDRGDGLFHRVRVGREASEEAALELAQRLRDAGFATQTFVVRMN